MFQTNQPDFNSIPEDPSLRQEVPAKADGTKKAGNEDGSLPTPEFATLEAFTDWIDAQLDELEANHEGFETVSSVRGFFGR